MAPPSPAVLPLIAAVLIAAALPSSASHSHSPSSAPSPAVDCLSVLVNNLLPCLTYVTNGSNLTVPDAGCCDGLTSLIHTQPICLCQLLGNPDQARAAGFPIDFSRALTLPAVCQLTTPRSACAAAGVSIGQTPSEASSNSFAPASAPTTSADVPTTSPSQSPESQTPVEVSPSSSDVPTTSPSQSPESQTPVEISPSPSAATTAKTTTSCLVLLIGIGFLFSGLFRSS